MKLPVSQCGFWVGLAWLRSANRWAAQQGVSGRHTDARPGMKPLVPESRYAVKSRRFPAGANPARPIGRSAGSNQSDEGGNEFVEVLW